jgi:glutaminyl-tRNA synthetase
MTDNSSSAAGTLAGNNFLRDLIQKQIESGQHQGDVVTRFPPEPNGYLHIGHAKSICTNFGLARHFNGRCNLRFDDTNPEKESHEYIESIKNDVQWLGFEWDGDIHYASDYFETLYEYALHLIENGDAYVCDLSAEEAREYRGTLTEPGKNSPHRERSPEENLDLFRRMRAGEFEDGSRVLRAKIDMASPNMNLRDPIIYRIRRAHHHQTGDSWCIYPIYDFTHGQSDALEGITHSICTLEFEDHRPLYNWFLEHLPVPAQPVQYEFGRLNLNYTVTSKRKLKQLVDENKVDGWDDPRMPTISGIRRRGYTPASIRKFCEMVGVGRTDGIVDMGMLEAAIREDLEPNAARGMAVLDPIKLVISNYPEEQVEELSAPGHPEREDIPTRTLPFTREIYIERDDFREEANKKYKRLVIGKKVRLRNAYVVLAESCVKDEDGNVTEVHVRYEPETLGADPADGVKPKGVIHWVSASHCKRATVRLYDRLFSVEAPGRGEGDFLEHLNPDSLTVLKNVPVEPSLAAAAAEQNFQFERTGFFVADRFEHSADSPVFNRTVPLRSSWNG